MNIFYKKSYWFTKRCISYSQIKYFLTKLKIKNTISVKYFSSLHFRRYIPLISNKCNKYNLRFMHSDNNNNNTEGDIDDIEDIAYFMPLDEVVQQQSVRNLLYLDSKDPLIIKLNNCASIQDVFNFVTENSEAMEYQHLAQTVLMLWDLQKVFFYAHQINRTMLEDSEIQSYIDQLISHPMFQKLLDLTIKNLEKFDNESLSCTLLYLNKMGLNIKHDVLQSLITQLERSIGKNTSLSVLSRFIVTVLSEYNLGSLLTVQTAVPLILDELEKCESAEDLKLITICLNHIQTMITNDILDRYKSKVRDFINKGQLTSTNYRTLLKILMFLSYPRWNDNNATLISEIMNMLQNNLHLLGILDFFIIYEVLYKNHEPGELLTEMQRCASKLLHHLEEEPNSSEIRLKLLSCIVCFSSPLHRPEYERIISKIIKKPITKHSMFDLLRILTFIKPSDTKLCEAFWDNVLKTVKDKELFKDNDILLKLCQKYMNYSSDVHYRHEQFEKEMLSWLYDEINNGIVSLIPSKLSMAAAFIFAYGNNEQIIDFVLQKLTENWEQLNHADCLYISKGVRSVLEIRKNPYITPTHIRIINELLNKSIKQKLISIGNTSKINFLVKSCIYRRNFKRDLLDNLLLTFKANEVLSSNSIRNIVFSLQATNSLLPDIIDNIADYVINYRDNLLGFNAEKVAYLCYHLGYTPKRSNKLFQAITDVIIRDQERISGLSYIQAALSLAFFYKLPDSFIKQIFNVAFLEKLDVELATCYFKDIYPIRVRHSMMDLNRTVCLDYPQCKVPWFHQKYIEQLQTRADKGKLKENEIISRVKTYLSKVVDDPQYLLQNVTTAYGYRVDFVVHLDNNGQLIKPNTDENANKIAILLMRSTAYTNINIQLRGQHQLKKRHLEILGYKVITMNLNEWNSLIYGEEKVEYLNKLIWPSSSQVADARYSIVER